jgi:hypothetical protein
MVIFAFVLFSSYAFSEDKMFSGRVIDAETKEPIEGAVVVAYWYEARTTTIGSESTRIKDVQECLTDKNGEWTILGEEGKSFNPDPYHSLLTGTYYTREPQFIVFKPGYCPWPEGFYVDSCEIKIKPRGNGDIRRRVTAELPKLSKEEDRLRIVPDIVGESFPLFRKQKAFMRLINEERRNLNLGINEMYEELVNEK